MCCTRTVYSVIFTHYKALPLICSNRIQGTSTKIANMKIIILLISTESTLCNDIIFDIRKKIKQMLILTVLRIKQ